MHKFLDIIDQGREVLTSALLTTVLLAECAYLKFEQKSKKGFYYYISNLSVFYYYLNIPVILPQGKTITQQE